MEIAALLVGLVPLIEIPLTIWVLWMLYSIRRKM
jgi:hypothetical protein